MLKPFYAGARRVRAGRRVTNRGGLAVTLAANPAKVEDFGDKDLLQEIDLARILFGEVISLRRDAR